MQVTANGLDLRSIPKLSYVTIRFAFAFTAWACTQYVFVQSEADWDGAKNPVDDGGHTYLVAADGKLGTWGNLTVARVAQGCLPGSKACPGRDPPDDYLLRFSTPASIVDAAMGEDVARPLPIGPGDALRVRDLRSFEEVSVCYGANDAFWAVRDV